MCWDSNGGTVKGYLVSLLDDKVFLYRGLHASSKLGDGLCHP